MIFEQRSSLGAPAKAAVIVPIVGTTSQVLADEARAGEAAGADVIEWRMDYFLAEHVGEDMREVGRSIVRDILEATSIPLLITVRGAAEGGQMDVSHFRYRVLMATILDLLLYEQVPPERIGVDLEFRNSATPDLAARVVELGFTPVISHHEWRDTPDSDVLRALLDDMLAVPDAVVKLAVYAHSEEDTQRLLEVTEAVSAETKRPLFTIAMGEAGRRSRLEGWKYGSIATFAVVTAVTAPGQLPISEVRAALTDEESE